MKASKKLTYGLVWVACVGIVCPTATFAQSPLPYTTAAEQQAPARLFDVALQPGGVLQGRVVNAQGQPVPNAPVMIRRDGVQVAQCVTDVEGGFSGENLQGGVHEVITPNGCGNARFWAPGSAPPIADSDICVVEGDPSMYPAGVYRGQMGSRFGFLANPWIIGAAVAAAIAIPLALDDDDNNAS